MKQKIKLTVTQLNDFYYFLNEIMFGDSILITYDKLIERITKPQKTTFPMMFGRSFGYFLNCPESVLKECLFRGMYIPIDSNEVSVNAEMIQKARKHVDLNGIPEVLKQKTFITDYYDVIVNGKCDNSGLYYIDEHKTTKQFNYNTYLEALQGKLYMNLFDVGRVNYIVFEINSKYNDIKDVHKFSFVRDENTDIEVKSTIDLYSKFIYDHNFRDYFKISRHKQF